MLSKLVGQYAGKNVRFISISADENPGNRKQRINIDRFLDDQKPAMEVWLGADLDALDHCGLGNVLPGTMILDANGGVISRIMGEARQEDITGPVDWLLNGERDSAPAALIKRY